jgi:small subunit ribosomal protein S14
MNSLSRALFPGATSNKIVGCSWTLAEQVRHMSWCHIRRDKIRRKAVSETEISRRVFKAIKADQRLDLPTRLRAQMQLDNMHSYTRPTEIHNRCILTGRPRSLLRHFRMSRIMMRDNALNGLLPGVTKATW